MKRHRLLSFSVGCFLISFVGLAVNIVVFHQHDATTSRLAVFMMFVGAILLAATWVTRMNERHEQEGETDA
jgi:uncharacterized membrane protein YdjX (TVP38/TMEM64 family)